MRRAALPVLIIACVIVAAVLAWLVLQRVFRPPSPAPGGPAVAEVLVPGPFSKLDVTGLASVEIVQGDRHEVRVEGGSGAVEVSALDIEGTPATVHTEAAGKDLRIGVVVFWHENPA